MYLEFSLLVLVLALGQEGNGLFGDKFNEQHVIYLHANETYVQEALNIFQSLYKENSLHIYCRRDQPLSLSNVFQSNRLRLVSEVPNMKYSQYKATTAVDVHEAHVKGLEFYEGKLLSGSTQRVHYITMPSFDHFCYGIQTDQAYTLSFMQDRCDFNRLALFAVGLIVWAATSSFSVGRSMIVPVVVLAVHLASWLLVCAVLFLHEDYRLRGLHPLSSSFKLVLNQYTTSSALVLLGGTILLVKAWQCYTALRKSYVLRSVHCRLMRLYAYFLILSASDNSIFGWTCVCMLLPWPELWWLLQRLHVKGIKTMRYMWPPVFPHLFTEPQLAAQSNNEAERVLNNLRQNFQAMQLELFDEFMNQGIDDPNQTDAEEDVPLNTLGLNRGKRSGG